MHLRRAAALLLAALTLMHVAVADDVTVDDLFRSGNISRADLSPDGRYVAWQQGVHNVNAGSYESGYANIHSFSDNQYIVYVGWTGNDTLITRTRSSVSGDYFVWVTRLGTKPDGEFGVLEERRHDVPGYILDALPESDDEVIFARWNFDDEIVFAEPFRINVYEERTKRMFGRKARLDVGSAELDYYLTNKAGEYFVGTQTNDGVTELWLRTPGTKNWTVIWRGVRDITFNLYGVSADETSVWALSNAFSDRIAVIEFDLTTKSLKQIYFEHPRSDISGMRFDDTLGVPEAAAFDEQGLTRYEFFSDERRALFDTLGKRFPDHRIAVVGSSLDDSVVLVRTYASNDPGHVYRCVLADDDCSDLGAVAPWLDGKPLSNTVALEVQSSDDILVDAFLTLPLGISDDIPLVAMPHGGPIGVSDDRDFSPDVQWLASNGYAVLQINFRGSGGYGKSFRAAGLRQWGRGIEDDVEAAVLQALQSYPQLNPDRVGILGSSYGGYSALMSMIRNPELFRCAASFAGVTDLTLLFSQSRERSNNTLRDSLIRQVGNPFDDYAEQRANSPVYRYEDISRPVFLAHGTADPIVDVEHSWRLRKLMELNGQSPTFVILDDVGHGFEYTHEAAALYEPLVKFLDKHLK